MSKLDQEKETEGKVCLVMYLGGGIAISDEEVKEEFFYELSLSRG